MSSAATATAVTVPQVHLRLPHWPTTFKRRSGDADGSNVLQAAADGADNMLVAECYASNFKGVHTWPLEIALAYEINDGDDRSSAKYITVAHITVARPHAEPTPLDVALGARVVYNCGHDVELTWFAKGRSSDDGVTMTTQNVWVAGDFTTPTNGAGVRAVIDAYDTYHADGQHTKLARLLQAFADDAKLLCRFLREGSAYICINETPHSFIPLDMFKQKFHDWADANCGRRVVLSDEVYKAALGDVGGILRRDCVWLSEKHGGSGCGIIITNVAPAEAEATM